MNHIFWQTNLTSKMTQRCKDGTSVPGGMGFGSCTVFFLKSHVEHRPWISWFNLPRIYPGTSIVQSFQDQTPTPPKFSQLYDRTSTKSPLLLGQGKKVQWFSNSLKKLIPVRVTKVDHERLLDQPDMNNNRETSWGNIKMGIETTDLTWSDRSHSFFSGTVEVQARPIDTGLHCTFWILRGRCVWRIHTHSHMGLGHNNVILQRRDAIFLHKRLRMISPFAVPNTLNFATMHIPSFVGSYPHSCWLCKIHVNSSFLPMKFGPSVFVDTFPPTRRSVVIATFESDHSVWKSVSRRMWS